MRIRASDTVLSVGVLEFRERCCCHEAFNRGWRDPFKWPLSLGRPNIRKSDEFFYPDKYPGGQPRLADSPPVIFPESISFLKTFLVMPTDKINPKN